MRHTTLRFYLSAFHLLFLPSMLFGQYPLNPNGIGVKKTFIDYYSTQNSGFPNFDDMSGGWEIGYYKNVAPFLNVGLPFRLSIADFPEELENQTLFSLDVVGQFQYFKRTNLVIPYAVAGIGVTGEAFDFTTTRLHAPLGLGFNINLFNTSFVNFQAEYRLGLGEDSRDHLHYGIGLLFLLKKEKKRKEKKKPLLEEQKLSRAEDYDRDGVANEEDECPREAGPVDLNGCPDTDGDGTADLADGCPDVPGPKDLQGCPDTDGDGLIDKEDGCPFLPGPISGCPDTDGDGIANKEDECPEEPGIAPDGCPEKESPDSIESPGEERTALSRSDMDEDTQKALEEALQFVQFNTSEAKLTPASLPYLDQLAEMMQSHPTYGLIIKGYTDDTGDSKNNLQLSEARARTCFEYLIEQGVSASRMEYRGYGEVNPVGDNQTAEGRRMNRRVEFELYQ